MGKDLLTQYEEQLYELQQQTIELNRDVVKKDKELRDLKNKTKLLENQIATVEEKYVDMSKEYDRTITTLKSKIFATSNDSIAAEGTLGISDLNLKSKSPKYKHLYEDTKMEMESIFMSIEKLKDTNARLAEENDNLNEFLRNQQVKKSLAHIQYDPIITPHNEKSNFFDTLKRFLK